MRGGVRERSQFAPPAGLPLRAGLAGHIVVPARSRRPTISLPSSRSWSTRWPTPGSSRIRLRGYCSRIGASLRQHPRSASPRRLSWCRDTCAAWRQTGAAYTAASILSKLIAVALLPLYTRYLTPADYGRAEVMFAAGRLGQHRGPARSDRGAAALLLQGRRGSRRGSRQEHLRRALLVRDDRRAAGAAVRRLRSPKRCSTPRPPAALGQMTELVRISIGGLWVLTMFEFMLTLFRLEERARAFFVTTILNVLTTIGGHDRPRRGQRRRGRARAAARQLRQWRRLRARADRAGNGGASRCASIASCCGGCCASACRRCRPRPRSTCSTSSTG